MGESLAIFYAAIIIGLGIYAIWLFFFPLLIIGRLNAILKALKKLFDVTESIRFEKKEKGNR